MDHHWVNATQTISSCALFSRDWLSGWRLWLTRHGCTGLPERHFWRRHSKSHKMPAVTQASQSPYSNTRIMTWETTPTFWRFFIMWMIFIEVELIEIFIILWRKYCTCDVCAYDTLCRHVLWFIRTSRTLKTISLTMMTHSRGPEKNAAVFSGKEGSPKCRKITWDKLLYIRKGNFVHHISGLNYTEGERSTVSLVPHIDIL